MNHAIAAVLTLLIANSDLVANQDNAQLTETRFHRVFLKNGNVLDGQVLQETPQSILLELPRGEMTVRMESIDRIEIVRMKSINEKFLLVPKIKERVVSEQPSVKPSGGPSKSAPGAIKLDPRTDEEVQNLLAEYARADVEQKQVALNKLIKMGGQVPAYLASVISRFDRDQVPLVLTALAQTKDAGLVPVLGGLLEAADPTLRINVVMALGMMGAPSALPYLSPLLQDKDPSVRSATVTTFSLIPSTDTFDPLIPLLLDPDRDTRTRAISTLNDLATKNSRKRDFGDALSTALQKAEGDVRLDLIFAIGRGKHTACWQALCFLLKEDSGSIRQATANALAELAVSDSAEAVLSAVLSEKESKVRVALAKSVEKLGLLRAGETLITWLNDSDQGTKEAARTALSALSGQNNGYDLEKWQAWWAKAKPQ